MAEPKKVIVEEVREFDGQNALNFSQKASDNDPTNSYMKFTGMAIAESVSSESLLENEQPAFLQGVENGMAPLHKVRGKKGLLIKAEDMIPAEDQALIEWKNIQFHVPVKDPPA